MATLATWKPVRDLFDIHREMDRVFDETFRGHGFLRRKESASWTPPVDIVETDDHVEIRAEVPGLKEEDIHVSITDNVLILKGEKKHESEVKEKNYHRVERSYGQFQRSFSLPRNFDGEKVKAKFKEGVLTVTLPKTEETKPKAISISAE